MSVKSLARTEGAGGAMRREELEGPADRTAGPIEWPASDARSLVLELAGDAALVELVTIRQLRRKRIVRDGETRVELSLDEVDVVARSRVIDRFVELEAELVKGAEERLTVLADVFAADPALAPATGSKLEAAMAAVKAGPGWHAAAERRGNGGSSRRPCGSGADAGPERSVRIQGVERIGGIGAHRRRRRPRRAEAAATGDGTRRRGSHRRGAADRATATEAAATAAEHLEVIPSSSDVMSDDIEDGVPADLRLVVGRTPGVTSDDHIAEAGRKVMRFHLARMLAREAGVARGPRPRGGPRDARRDPPAAGGLARVRSVVPTRSDEALSDRAARDRVATRGRSRPRRPARGGRHLSRRHAGRRAAGARAAAARLARAPRRCPGPAGPRARLRRLPALGRRLSRLRPDRWCRGRAGRSRPSRTASAIRRASRIWTAYEQVRGYEPVLRWADVETLHELRIAGKWLRYTLEFVREALGDDAAPLIARVTALQDHLGLMNDADVSASMARTFLVEHAGDLSALESAAIGRYLVSREREVARLRRSIGAPWRGVAGVTFRRTLGRVVARL